MLNTFQLLQRSGQQYDCIRLMMLIYSVLRSSSMLSLLLLNRPETTAELPLLETVKLVRLRRMDSSVYTAILRGVLALA